jgi:hypothetical protein
MESELDVLGVVKKLVKYLVYLSKKTNWKKIKNLLIGCPIANNQFLV